MSGFRATADPMETTDYRVTHAYVLDPLHPLHSTTWGRSPEPNSRLSLETLGHYFVPRRRGRSGLLAGRYVLVMPVDAARPPVTTRALPV